MARQLNLRRIGRVKTRDCERDEEITNSSCSSFHPQSILLIRGLSDLSHTATGVAQFLKLFNGLRSFWGLPFLIGDFGVL